MSGGLLHIKLADGSEYEMPEDEAFPAMQDLEKRGIKFDATEVPARAELDPSTQPDAQADGAGRGPEQPSGWRGLLDKVMSGGADADTLAKVREARPVGGWENFDKAAVSLVSPVQLQGASMLGRLGASAVNQGAAGGLSGGFNAALEGKDAADIAKDTAIGTGIGAAFGTAGGLVGEAGRGVAKLGQWVGEGADKARLYAAGLGDESVAKALADRLGVSALPKDLAALVERITPSMKGGMSATERATELGGELNSIGDQLGQKYDYAGQTEGLDDFVPGAWSAIAQRMGLKARAVPQATAGERALRGALESNAAAVAAEPPPSSLRGLVQRKSAWQGEGHSGPGGNVPDVGSKQAAADMGRVAKEELEDVMQYATPQTQLDARALNRDYQVRAALKEAAENAPKDNVPGWIPRVGGAIVGGAAGGALSGPGGALVGAGSGAMYGARAASNMTGTRGADYWANIGRMLERQAPDVASGISAFGDAASNVGTREAVGLEDLLREDEERRRY